MAAAIVSFTGGPTMLRSPYLRHSAVVRALLATSVLYFVLDLSAGDRGLIDWVVIAAVGAAIAWNLVRLSIHMYAGGGGRALWHTHRTALFWIVGLMNTLWIRPEDTGTWKNWIGIAMLAIAIADTVVLWRKERRLIEAHATEHAAG
jgi:hypothetical protein